jgi:hypothetical protein
MDKFDSCSYEELTDCIRSRIEWVREYREVLSDPNMKKYSHTRHMIALSLIDNRREIKILLNSRRILKSSGMNNMAAYKNRRIRI